MKVKHHIISSGIISSAVYILTNSTMNTVASFLAGIFIDMDHFIDYYLNYGFSYKFKEIYKAVSEVRLSKIYVLLHSYELLAIFWALIFIVPLSNLYLAIAIGFTQHIFLDQIYNPAVTKAYFLSYRVSKKFKKEQIINS